MKTIKTIGMFSLLIAGLLLTGCSTMKVEPGTAGLERPASGPAGEAQIVRSTIPVKVVDSSAKKTKGTSDVKSLVESQLAQAGFAVKDSTPFITVNLSTMFTPVDSFGSYKVYEGGSFINVTRADSQVLLKKQIRAKGDRQLEDGRAIDAAQDQLAAEVAKEVVAVCNEKTTGISSVIASLKNYSEKELTRFSGKMRDMSGILSCRRIADGGKTIQYRVIYDARKFPDGILTLVKNAAD